MLRLAVSAAAFLACVAAAADTPSQARLTINDNVYNVPLGRSFAVQLDGKRVTMRIDPQSEREFAAAGVAFRYPADLQPSESRVGDGVTVWTLQGDNAAVMLQRYEQGLDAESLLEVMVTNLAESDGETERQAVKLSGAERDYRGVQLRTRSAADAGTPATVSVQNVFAFANSGGVFALMVQDVHAPDAGPSDEYGEALRLLGESLTTGEPPEPPEPPADEPAPPTP